MSGIQADRLARSLAFGVPLALLAGAYVSQYVFGLHPCEMCWWQRYAHFAALVVGLAAWLLPSARWLTGLAGLAIGLAGLLGLYHAGVEYDWWEGLTACTATALPQGGDPLDAIMNAPIVRCDEAPWSLLGISLAGWNFLVSSAAALAIGFLLTRKRTRAA